MNLITFFNPSNAPHRFKSGRVPFCFLNTALSPCYSRPSKKAAGYKSHKSCCCAGGKLGKVPHTHIHTCSMPHTCSKAKLIISNKATQLPQLLCSQMFWYRICRKKCFASKKPQTNILPAANSPAVFFPFHI